MSNSLGTITPTLVAQEALSILTDQFPFVKAFVTDFSNEPVVFNQTVYSRIPTVGSAQAYDTTNGYVAENATLTDVPVTINKFMHSTRAFNDQEVSSTNLNLVQTFASSLAAEMGNDIMSTVAGLVTTGNYANSVAVASGSLATRANAILASKKVLDSNKVPTNDRFFITGPVSDNELLQDESIVKLTWGANGVLETQIPPLHGFQFGQYTSLPTTSSLIGIALQKNAIVIATRIPNDPAANGISVPGKITIVTDPKTGFSIQVREFYDMGKGKLQVTWAWQYGCAVGSASNLVRVTRAGG